MAGGGVPKGATLKAFLRSTTFSLGSIAFGSLIVTILELLRLLLQSVQQYEAGQGDSEYRSSGDLTSRSDWTDRRMLCGFDSAVATRLTPPRLFAAFRALLA